MRNVVVISPTPSHPQNAGNRARVFSLLSNMREMGHDVYFVHIQDEADGDEIAMREHWGNRFFSIPYVSPQIQQSEPASRKWYDPRRLFKRTHQQQAPSVGRRQSPGQSIDDWYDSALDHFLSELTTKVKFDVVLVEYVFYSKALACFGPESLKIIDTIDVFSERHESMARAGLTPNWYTASSQEEARGLNRSDVAIAISEDDRRFLSQLTEKQVVVVGHIVPLCHVIRATPGTDVIVFVGSANPPNVRSVLDFLHMVFPLVKQKVPAATLLLAGRVCSEIGEYEGCIKLGVVDDIAPLYEQADLVVNPVQFGTGIAIKTIEALAHARPVVATSIGARGLEDIAQGALTIANTPEDFADAVVKLLTDAELRNQMASVARNAIERWNNIQLTSLGEILAAGSHIRQSNEEVCQL